MDIPTDRADKDRMYGRQGLLVLAAGLIVVAALNGCADEEDPVASRLDRLEARLDRLDERLTRTEGHLEERQAAAPGGGESDRRSDRLQALLGDMDPERRERLRRRYGRMRRRMERLEEGADLSAEPGSPEFRRGLILEMMRQGRPGRRSFDEERAESDGEGAPEQ